MGRDTVKIRDFVPQTDYYFDSYYVVVNSRITA